MSLNRYQKLLDRIEKIINQEGLDAATTDPLDIIEKLLSKWEESSPPEFRTPRFSPVKGTEGRSWAVRDPPIVWTSQSRQTRSSSDEFSDS